MIRTKNELRTLRTGQSRDLSMSYQYDLKKNLKIKIIVSHKMLHNLFATTTMLSGEQWDKYGWAESGRDPRAKNPLYPDTWVPTFKTTGTCPGGLNLPDESKWKDVWRVGAHVIPCIDVQERAMTIAF
eukprot:751645-Hanusia_phi.AAC.1